MGRVRPIGLSHLLTVAARAAVPVRVVAQEEVRHVDPASGRPPVGQAVARPSREGSAPVVAKATEAPTTGGTALGRAVAVGATARHGVRAGVGRRAPVQGPLTRTPVAVRVRHVADARPTVDSVVVRGGGAYRAPEKRNIN